jgi:uncharacterized membrane protein YoaK (UPF0700 family)
LVSSPAWSSFRAWQGHGILRLGVENSRVLLLVALTFVTGSVDAVSYLGLGRVFTANMTGNVAMLGFAASGTGGLPLLRNGGALVAFVVGAVVAGRAVRGADERAIWPVPVTVATATAALLLGGVFFAWAGHSRPPHPNIIAIALAFAMGLQGAATRKLGVADLPTTVVTSTLTGLAADSSLAGGASIRWRRRASALAALMAGAVSGALLVQVSPALGLLPALVVLTTVSGLIASARLHEPVERRELAAAHS